MSKVSKTQLSMVFFFITGLSVLSAVWFLDTKTGLFVWRIAKVFYFAGLAAFIFNLFTSKK
ncbi:MAG: hypothetical protein WDZ40_04545 [Candidatus Spechtbacterales bacterium]